MSRVEFASKSLLRGDSVKKTYMAKLDGAPGYISISSQKLLFIKEQGFLKKTRSVTLNLPFSKVENVTMEGRGELTITETDGSKHKLTITEVPVKLVIESLQAEMKQE